MIEDILHHFFYRLFLPFFVIIGVYSGYKYFTKPEPIGSDLEQICKIYSKTALMFEAKKITYPQVKIVLKKKIDETIRSKKILKIIPKIDDLSFKDQEDFYLTVAQKNGVDDWDCPQIQILGSLNP